jgi:type II secretory pathway pseudopilin PulG
MKKHFFTLTELLTVISIIIVLAGIALPSISYARQRARRTACISNQGQTAKIIMSGMGDDHMLYSGKTNRDSNTTEKNDNSWTTHLAKKNLIKSMDALRCPALEYDTDSKPVGDTKMKSAMLAEAYGLVYTEENNGKMDFRGSKLLTFVDGTTKSMVSASALVFGGCVTNGADLIAKNLLVNEKSSNPFTNKLAPVHHDGTNIFFRDGHAASVQREELVDGAYYYPAQTGAKTGEAKKLIADSDNWLNI